MKINGPNDSISNAGNAFPIRDAKHATAKPKPQTTPEPPKKDTVEISAEGRAKAEQSTAAPSGTLSAERQSEIRSKILEGAYNTADMAGEVAKRILRSGDV